MKRALKPRASFQLDRGAIVALRLLSYVEDSTNKFTILDSFGQPESQHEWSISTSPNGGKLLTITEIVEDPIASQMVQPSYYLVTSNLLTEVELNTAFDTTDNKQLYRFTWRPKLQQYPVQPL